MKNLTFSVLSGLCLALSFPNYSLDWMAWVALVFFFQAIKNSLPHQAAGHGFLTGLVFYLASTNWVINTLIDYGHLPWIVSAFLLLLLAIYLSFYFALFGFLSRLLSRGDPAFLFLLSPTLWVGLEYLRSNLGQLGFGWQGLGYSQYKALPVVQIAEFTGVYGVSALIVLINVGVHCLIEWFLSFRNNPHPIYRPIILCCVVLFLGNYYYGTWAIKMHETPNSPSVKVAIAQGNIAQDIKWDASHRQESLDIYRNLTREAAVHKPDLMVWPEASTPFYFLRDEKSSHFVRDFVKESQVPLVFGSPAQIVTGGKKQAFNSAYYLSKNGDPIGRYDKIQLVPFGEFVPFHSYLTFVDKMVVGIGDFGRGEEFSVFALDDFRFGISICFEITFPDLVRRPVERGAQFLLNLTNDAWFGLSSASEQHLSMASLRAIENRVPIVRAANTGISGLIHPTGKIEQASELFVRKTLVGEIQPKLGGNTLYTEWGDVFSWFCIVFSIIWAHQARRLVINRPQV